MRTFNKREKKVLKLLVEISDEKFEYFSFFLQHKYFTKENNSALFLITKQKKALLYLKADSFNDLDKRKKEIVKFIEFVSLIQNLKENRFINIIPSPQSITPELLIMKEHFNAPKQDGDGKDIILNEQNDHIKFSDISKIYNSKNKVEYIAVGLEDPMYDLIIDNFMGLLFVSEELKEFVKNDYKSKDDLRYKNSQIATWASIILALLFGLFGIYNPFEKQNETELNSKQLDTIINQLEKVIIDKPKIKDNIDTTIKIDSIVKEK